MPAAPKKTAAKAPVAPEEFCHLHVHSEFSSLDGACKIKDLVALAKERGHTALGLSDHGTISGLPAFEKACRAEGIKPILSCEIYLTDDRHIHKRETKTWHLGLIARTSEGLHNLYALTSWAYIDGYFGGRPRADWELLERYSEGIIALTGCMAAPVMNAIFQGDLTLARAHTERLIQIYGAENVYGEIQDAGIVEQMPADSELAHKLGKFTLSQEEANHELAAICRDLNIPLIATGDVHYLNKTDAFPHDALLCVGTGQLQQRAADGSPDLTNRRFSLLPKNYHFRTETEMRDNMPHYPEAFANTVKLAERCDAEISYDHPMLPRFPIPDGYRDSEAYLRHLCEIGMEARYGPRGQQTDEQRDRLEFELGVIGRMGFNDYFLIIHDFVREAIKRGIPSGPGRGSAAGSIVAYALEITHLDPLKYGLLFERFLNPDRVSMPDIDWDLSIVRRGEMIEYAKEKYNTLAGCETAVSQIVTHSMIGAKAALRDAARVLGKPIALANKLCSMVPTKPIGIGLRDTYAAVPEFRRAFESTRDAKEVITLAGWMEGYVRGEGIHAAGVVIWDKPLEQALPLQRKGKDQPITTAWDMKISEAVGTLKMDFLGLRNLDIIQRAVEIVQHTEGITLEPYSLPLDDTGTFEMLARGEAIGVFQFECLSGDTILNGGPRTTIAEMYERPPKNMVSVDFGAGLRRRNKVVKVVKSGEKQLYRLRAEGGYTLRASADHRILTANGWQTMGELQPGERIAVNERDASRIGACLDCGVQIKSRGTCCRSCANKRQDSGRRMNRNRDEEKRFNSLLRGPDSPQWGMGPSPAQIDAPDLPHPVRSYWEADFARAAIANDIDYVYEPDIFVLANGSSYTPDFYLPEFDLYVEVKGKAGLCGKGKRKFDQFRAQYRAKDIIVVKASEIAAYQLENPNLAKWGCPQMPDGFGLREIIAIEPDKVEMTYDVMMQAPHNNFIANGIVVHNSGGMREALRLIRPTTFDDIIALVALYRPGPMDYIPTYAARKHGKEETTFLDPRLEPITGPTYGICVYQEQNMTIAKDIAQFAPGEADTLRKAIGKKDAELMASLKPKFISGCVTNGLTKTSAEQLWTDNERSADYSFNKSHAASYGLISYITAHLKHNHPAAYMAALISLNAGTKDKVPFFITEARRMGLRVLPPDLNRSLRDFAVMETDGASASTPKHERFEILFGLQAIKGVGANVIAAIRSERDAHGPYRSLLDLSRRVPTLNRSVLERLITAGALDFTGHSRKAMFEAVDPMLKESKRQAAARTKLFQGKVAEQVLAARSNADDEPTLFDGGAGVKPGKLTTMEKRGIEAVGKLADQGRTAPGSAEARAVCADALNREAMRVARLAARKADAEDVEATATGEVAAGATERAEVAKALSKETRVAIERVLATADTDEDEMEAALDDQLLVAQMTGLDWPDLERLARERAVLGLYASGHPLDASKRQWRRYISNTLGSISGADIGSVVTVVGAVTGARILKKKTGERFGLEIELEDLTGSRPVTFFDDSLNDADTSLLIPGEVCTIKAKVMEDAFRNSRRDEEEADDGEVSDGDKAVKLNGLAVHPWLPEKVDMTPIRPLEITLPASHRSATVIARLKETLGGHPGPSPVYLLLGDARHKLRERVTIGPTLQRELASLLGVTPA